MTSVSFALAEICSDVFTALYLKSWPRWCSHVFLWLFGKIPRSGCHSDNYWPMCWQVSGLTMCSFMVNHGNLWLDSCAVWPFSVKKKVICNLRQLRYWSKTLSTFTSKLNIKDLIHLTPTCASLCMEKTLKTHGKSLRIDSSTPLAPTGIKQ